jgi:hypothetical protein
MLHELGKDIATFVHRALPCDGHVARSARIRIPIEIETASKSQFRLPTQNVSLHPTSNVGTALIEDNGETILKPGDCAGFKAGVANGHHLVNKSQRAALYLEIGTRAAAERAHYPDVDLMMERDGGGLRFLHKSGEPYPPES